MKKTSINSFAKWKREGRRFACLTAYDAPTARILEESGIELILVGDSVANVVLGHNSTVPVTLEEMIHHAAAVRRGAPNSFVVGDLPFLTYQVSPEQAIENAGRMLKEALVDAVKVEGGRALASTIRRMVDVGIPVMGHIGLTPQTATQLGGYRVQGTDEKSADSIIEDAKALEEAGVFSLVIECVPAELGQRVTSEVSVPTIGIGAGKGCDAQILVAHDVLGIRGAFQPKFVRAYADLETTISNAVRAFVSDVKSGSFPNEKESFSMPKKGPAALEGS